LKGRQVRLRSSSMVILRITCISWMKAFWNDRFCGRWCLKEWLASDGGIWCWSEKGAIHPLIDFAGKSVTFKCEERSFQGCTCNVLKRMPVFRWICLVERSCATPMSFVALGPETDPTVRKTRWQRSEVKYLRNKQLNDL
jgi:hypothetical protein